MVMLIRPAVAAALVAFLAAEPGTSSAAAGRQGPFDDAPTKQLPPPEKRVPHEYEQFVDGFRKRIDEAAELMEALAENGAPESANGLALELLRADAKGVADAVVDRALINAGVAVAVDKVVPADPKTPRTALLLKALKEGLLPVNGDDINALAGSLRIELRKDRMKLAAGQNPDPRKAIANELTKLSGGTVPKAIANRIRTLRKLAADAPITTSEFRALSEDNLIPVATLLGLVGEMSSIADSKSKTETPASSPRRLREFRDAMAGNPACGAAPAANQPFFSIPGHENSDGGGSTLNEGGPNVRIVRGPESPPFALQAGTKLLESPEFAAANQARARAEALLASKNPAFPIELFGDNSVSQCNGAFATATGSPLRTPQNRTVCVMPYQTAKHCVTPLPKSIRIARLSSQPFLAQQIEVSATGDQAVINIAMPCSFADNIPVLKIATPAEVSRARFGVLFTNPKRHRDDGKKLLVMGITPGNDDYIGFNADLQDAITGQRVNDGVGTRVGDSGGPMVVFNDNGEPRFAGANSFGIFPDGDPKQNPSLYAQQGGIAFGGQTDTLALINKAREQALPGTFASIASQVDTHKNGDQKL